MNAVESAFRNAQNSPGETVNIRYGLYKLSFKDGDMEAFKPNDDPFTEEEIGEVKVEITALTNRRWVRLAKNNEDHHARFALVPEFPPITGSSASPDDVIFPAPNDVNVAIFHCHHKNEECRVELLMDGLHYETPAKYGHCLDCGRCFVSIQKAQAETDSR